MPPTQRTGTGRGLPRALGLSARGASECESVQGGRRGAGRAVTCPMPRLQLRLLSRSLPASGAASALSIRVPHKLAVGRQVRRHQRSKGAVVRICRGPADPDRC
eukprot:4633536-Alexandrium_andersonii.AAC.1